MRNIFIVAWFTIREAARKKSFLVSNIIIIALIFILFSMIKLVYGRYVLPSEERTQMIANNIQISNENSTSEDSIVVEIEEEEPKDLPIIAIVDSNNVLADYLEEVKNDYFKFEKSTLPLEEIKEKILSNELSAAVVLSEENNSLSFEYIVIEENTYTDTELDIISEVIETSYRKKLLLDANVSEDTIEKITSHVTSKISTINVSEGIDAAYLVGIVTSFVLFMSIYLYGHSISLSIASEKSSRVMETLVTSSSPLHIVLGKTIGMGLLGLAQLLVLILITVFCYNVFIPEGIDIINLYFSDIHLNASSVLLLLTYFILGYTLYAFLNAITGATVSKAEDVQSANLPLSFISMISFYLSFFTINSNESKISEFASTFPLSSPFSMPSKILAGSIPNGVITSSIFILLITTVLLAFISIRIYSVAVLHYGNRLKIRDIFNIFIRFK